MDDGLTPERVEQAMARPGVGDELHALGVRDVSGFNPAGASEFLWPKRNEERILQVVDKALGDLEQDERLKATDELDVGGKGYTDAEVAAAVDLLTRHELGPRALEREGSMSFGRARRLSAWFTSGAAAWDAKAEKLTAASGFRWVKRKTREGPRLALIRTD